MSDVTWARPSARARHTRIISHHARRLQETNGTHLVLTKHGEKSRVRAVSSTLCSSHICGAGAQQRQDNILIPYTGASNSEETSKPHHVASCNMKICTPQHTSLGCDFWRHCTLALRVVPKLLVSTDQRVTFPVPCMSRTSISVGVSPLPSSLGYAECLSLRFVGPFPTPSWPVSKRGAQGRFGASPLIVVTK